MRLPRWLVVCMLGASFLAVACAGAWWWITWPERTIRDFMTLMAAGRFDEANKLLKPPDRWFTLHHRPELIDLGDGSRMSIWATSRTVWESNFERAVREFKFDSRGLSDLMFGRASVTFDELPRSPTRDDSVERHWRLAGWVINAERGEVWITRPDLSNTWRAGVPQP